MSYVEDMGLDYDVDDEDQVTTCKFCGSTDVYWSQERGQWKLRNYERGNIHACRPHVATVDEFKDLT